MEIKTYRLKVRNDIYWEEHRNKDNNEEKCPIPLKIFPEYMGINLSGVDAIEWSKQADGQLTEIRILFSPSSSIKASKEELDAWSKKDPEDDFIMGDGGKNPIRIENGYKVQY